MTKTTTYTWQGKVFDTEAKAQEEASSSVSKIQKDFSNTCSVIAVETDIKKYSAFIISQANRLTSHPKDLSDDDPRKFSFYCQGSDNHLPVSALKVKTLHREEFDNYINKKNIKKIQKSTFPTRLLTAKDEDETLKNGEEIVDEILFCKAEFIYG